MAARPRTGPATARDEHDEGIRVIAQRIEAIREPLARSAEERIRADDAVADRGLDARATADHAYELSLERIDAFLGFLRGSQEPLPASTVARVREVAARRVHQRLPLDAVLHRGRVWAEVVWAAVVANTNLDRPGESTAAMAIAAALIHQVDVFSSVVADAYLDEATDRGLLRRDLLDALISDGDAMRTRRLARSLHVTLAEAYIAVVVRGDGLHGELGADEPLASRVALDRIVEATRGHVGPTRGSLLAGMRHGDLVVLYPVSGPQDLRLVRDDCVELAQALTVDVSIGMSLAHRGLSAIADAYAEARAAVDVAEQLNIRGRAVGLDEVLVEDMLRASPSARLILAETMQSLAGYDAEHDAELLATLRAYLRTRCNLTRAARLLPVHPNTVVYRLRRIREVSGRDPYDADDLLVLALGLKVLDLEPEHPAAS